jgi:phosphatidylserine decarboxylase
MVKLFANLIWRYIPGILQKKVSNLFSKLFEMKLSRLFILPYCIFFGLNSDYLEQFESDSGDEAYLSYSDFFKRKYRSPINIESDSVWPCEGYICDWGYFEEKEKSDVKGQVIDLNSIFATLAEDMKDYFFLNVFLHNHNYHRVHAPISGTISNIIKIPGDLVFLRPWFYRRADVSYPAIRNERVIFEIADQNNKPWYMAMVGGFGVGTIELSAGIAIGSLVTVGQEIGKFKLGSTVCLATPVGVDVQKFLQQVSVGQKISSI